MIAVGILWNIFFIAFAICYVTAEITLLVQYILSGEIQYRRILRKMLKDKSLSKQERDSIRFELVTRRFFDKF